MAQVLALAEALFGPFFTLTLGWDLFYMLVICIVNSGLCLLLMVFIGKSAGLGYTVLGKATPCL